MDPDAALERLWTEAEEEGNHRILDALHDLDEWLKKGGFPPSDWVSADSVIGPQTLGRIFKDTLARYTTLGEPELTEAVEALLDAVAKSPARPQFDPEMLRHQVVDTGSGVHAQRYLITRPVVIQGEFHNWKVTAYAEELAEAAAIAELLDERMDAERERQRG